MTKEQIEALSLEAYPIILDYEFDENYYERQIYIKALTKKSELLFTEEQMKEAMSEAWRMGLKGFNLNTDEIYNHLNNNSYE